MKVICDKQSLSTAITSVSLAVSSKSSLPALEGILFAAKEGRLFLTGYDLELGIATSIEARVQEEGEVVLSAKLLADIVRRMPAEEISISCNQRMMTELKSGVAQYSILGQPAAEFPELPALTDTSTLSLPQSTLASMIGQTHFAIAVSDSKPVHTGSLFELDGEHLTIVSVDGYRLAMRREPMKYEGKLSFIVPGKTLSDLLRLLEDDDTPVALQVSKKHILFGVGHYTVVSRLLEGEFLNYRAAIPTAAQTTVTVQTRELMDSIDRTSLLIQDRLKSPLRVRFGRELIQISCSTAMGSAYDEVGSTIQGPEVEVGFNNRFLIDALRATGCDMVVLELSGPTSPMKVLPPQGEDFLFLVLPVRLKND